MYEYTTCKLYGSFLHPWKKKKRHKRVTLENLRRNWRSNPTFSGAERKTCMSPRTGHLSSTQNSKQVAEEMERNLGGMKI